MVIPNFTQRSTCPHKFFHFENTVELKHPCKCGRVYEDSALAKLTDVTNLLVDELKYPWKLLVVMHIGLMERMKDRTEAYAIC